MHIRLTRASDGAPVALPLSMLATSVIRASSERPQDGTTIQPERGAGVYCVQETPDWILAAMSIARYADPTRPASIEEERESAGWVREYCEFETMKQTAYFDGPRTEFRAAPGHLGQWTLHVSGLWLVRWLIPAQVTP